MKALVFGCMSMVGKSAKTSNHYEMYRLYVASEIQAKKTDAYTRQGAGYECAEIEVEQAAMPLFLSRNYPVVLDLVTDMRLHGGKMVPVITGVLEASVGGKAAA